MSPDRIGKRRRFHLVAVLGVAFALFKALESASTVTWPLWFSIGAYLATSATVELMIWFERSGRAKFGEAMFGVLCSLVAVGFGVPVAVGGLRVLLFVGLFCLGPGIMAGIAVWEARSDARRGAIASL